MLEKVGVGFANLGFGPNFWTWLGLILSIISAIMFSLHSPSVGANWYTATFLGGLFLIIAGFFDAIATALLDEATGSLEPEGPAGEAGAAAMATPILGADGTSVPETEEQRAKRRRGRRGGRRGKRGGDRGPTSSGS